jgi:Xaa-Pro dipeptidase
LAERVIVGELLRYGILKNGSVDELLARHLGALFFPHGLGHLLGIDTHDVGGYPPGSARIDAPGLKKLRTVRTLEAGMFITVEPGLYFNFSTLDPALKDPLVSCYLDGGLLETFRTMGGVRIESNVLVTPHGAENFTRVPRAVADVEAVMGGGEWDAAPLDHSRAFDALGALIPCVTSA